MAIGNNSSATSNISNDALMSERVGIATTLAFFVGLVQVCNQNCMKYKSSTTFCFQLVLWLFRLGFITIYMTEPFISGLNVGAAIQIFSSQIPPAFGVTNPNDIQGFFKLPKFYVRVIGSIFKSINWVSTAITFTTITILLLVKHFNERYKAKIRIILPTELILVCSSSIFNSFEITNHFFFIKNGR
jgi:hypothetical protein